MSLSYIEIRNKQTQNIRFVQKKAFIRNITHLAMIKSDKFCHKTLDSNFQLQKT